MSYDTIIGVNDPFYNPGGVISCIDDLIGKIDSLKLNLKYNIKPRKEEKHKYEGLFTFEYIKSEEDILTPTLYKDINTAEPLKKEELVKLINYLLSFKNKDLQELILNLKYLDYIPIELLSKYLIRSYTLESDFYKQLNKDLMQSNMLDEYKAFIKILYFGIDKKSFYSSRKKFLYRGAKINKSEIEKILNYKKEGKIQDIIVFSKAYLSFSEEEDEAAKFIGSSDNKTQGVLYILDNSNKDKMESNANIQEFSAYPEEKEILFFPGSSFIINDIIELNNGTIKIILNYFGKFKE